MAPYKQFSIPRFVILIIGLCFTAMSEDTVRKTSSSDHSLNFFSPSDRSMVAAYCQWQLNHNFEESRIPQKITEIKCTNPGLSCGGSQYFTCRQVKTNMQVTYGLRVSKEGVVTQTEELDHRNITLNMGCSCSSFNPILAKALREERQNKAEF